MTLKLWYVFQLRIEGPAGQLPDIEEIDVEAESREEAWRLAEEVRTDLYGGAGVLRLAE